MQTRLNLGSGYFPQEGWTNIEVDGSFPGVDLVCDVRQLPYESLSVDRIYAAHLCEHLPLADLEEALAEWWRLLAPKGQLMIVVPDIDRALLLDESRDLLMRIRISDFPPPHGHAWTCSGTVLRYFIEKSGFDCEEVGIADVQKPEWPIVATDAYQSAFRCWI